MAEWTKFLLRKTVLSPPSDIYQQTKLEGERLAQAAIERGEPVTIVRPRRHIWPRGYAVSETILHDPQSPIQSCLGLAKP